MGTQYTVEVLLIEVSSRRFVELKDVVEATLADVNAKMSHYVEDSEVSRLNRWTEAGLFEVSADPASFPLRRWD